MTSWLVVTLMAPFASFGERAGNVERSTADRPTRSALIGLAGAALGIRRDEREGQRRLAESFRVATATFSAGTLVSDFHTYQSLPSASKPAPRTRAQALLRKEDLNTSITRREYRADVWHEAAYACEPDAHWTLEELAAAFRSPRFVLFLGRKSCPPGAPLDPRIMEVDDLIDLFAKRRCESAWLDSNGPLFSRSLRSVGRVTVAAERQADLGAMTGPARRHRRYDEPGDRESWQFVARREFVTTLSFEKEAI
ncbi:MAG: type I-E CRISPR-associated protein Cas5/CasD [Pseudorhodoplanes sp.]